MAYPIDNIPQTKEIGDKFLNTEYDAIIASIRELIKNLGLVAGSFVPAVSPGSALPTGEGITAGKAMILQEGTYTQSSGNIVVEPNHVVIAVYDGTSWAAEADLELNADLSAYATKEQLNDKIYSITESENLVDKSNTLDGYIIRSDNGQLVHETGSASTYPIPLNGINTVTLSGQNSGQVLGFRFLDSSGTPLMASETNNGVPTTFSLGNNGWATAPANAVSVQLSYRKNNVGDTSALMLNKGKVPFTYRPYKAQPIGLPKVKLTVDQKADASDIFTAGGANLINPHMRIVDGYRIRSTDGTDFEEEGAAMTELIPVKGDAVYRLDGRNNTGIQFRFLTADMVPKKPLVGTTETDFTFPNGAVRRSPVDAKWAQIVFRNNGQGDLSTLFLYEGSEAKSYEKYIPVINPSKITGFTLTGGYQGTSKNLFDLIEQNINNILSLQDVVNSSSDDINQLQSDVSQKINTSEKASPGGVATLNSFGKIPASQIDISGMKLIGNYDPVTNTPSLSDGTGVANNYYIISRDGSHDFGSGEITFKKGDKVVYSSEGKWILDTNREAPAPVSDAGLNINSQYIRVENTLFNVFNEHDRSYRNYVKVDTFKNGTTITDAAIDNRLYIKVGNEYFAESRFLSYGIVDSVFYGVKSDGVTNDEPVMQILVNFLNFIGGGVIHLASGRTRLFNKGIKWLSNVSMVGKGIMNSILQCDTDKQDSTNLNGIYNTDMPGDGSVWNPVMNAHFRDFMIDCSGYHNLGKSDVGRKGMFILGMDRCSIERVFVYRSIGTGIGCDFLTRTSIKGCIVQECGSYIGDGTVAEIGQSGIGIGTAAQEDESVLVDGNWCLDNGNYGIFVESQLGRQGTKSRYAKIVNNHCIRNKYGIGNRGSGGAIISGNTCYGNREHGVFVNLWSGSNLILGNKCGYNLKSGIFVATTDVAGESDQISNNQCHHNEEYGIYLQAGDNFKNIVVNGNRVNNNGLSGIFVGYYTYNFTISDNIVFDNGVKNNIANCFGIFVRSGYFHTVKNNHVYTRSGTQLKGIVVSKGNTSATLPVVKPTVVLGNVVTGYSNADGISFTDGAVDGVDYINQYNVVNT